MTSGRERAGGGAIADRFRGVRGFTETLCAPLHVEDYVAQSMPDASPVKWHLAHTTWFFEVFVLAAHEPGFRPYDPRWNRLHNSYYEALGARHPRPCRGLLTRPSVEEIYRYRHAIDERIGALLGRGGGSPGEVERLVELGLHHEQQHQELILTDLQHLLSCSPLRPEIRPLPERRSDVVATSSAAFRSHPGGLVDVGHAGDGFAFDNEGPAHRVYLEPFRIASALVTAAEYSEFIDDGGYARPELWLSDGWATVCAEGWQAPLYWERTANGFERYSLHGQIPVAPDAPVCHVSYYEADAYARYRGARLPTEAEWEIVASAHPGRGQFVDSGCFVPLSGEPAAFLGGAWTWTASPYMSYPGYEPAHGALGEYNGKFMVNQMVLRGGSCLSSRTHLRATYRNFFPPSARWQATGIRLAKFSGSE